jgi:hypothetical protein
MRHQSCTTGANGDGFHGIEVSTGGGRRDEARMAVQTKEWFLTVFL